MTGEKIKVAIIGGGIWGLSAAYHLARKGQEDVVVLYADLNEDNYLSYRILSFQDFKNISRIYGSKRSTIIII